MTKLSIRIASALFTTAVLTGSAMAGDAPAADKPAAAKPVAKAEAKKPAAAPAAGDAAAPAAEVKAAKGVEAREPVEEGTSFAAGTKVWVWSRVTGAKGTKVKHVWKRDGKEIWSTPLSINSDRWVTHSRRQLKAGEYTVDVLAADGSSLGSVAFSVQ